MFGNKLTNTLKKVNGFVEELQAGIQNNDEQQEVIHDEIIALEDKSDALAIESAQAKKLLALFND